MSVLSRSLVPAFTTFSVLSAAAVALLACSSLDSLAVPSAGDPEGHEGVGVVEGGSSKPAGRLSVCWVETASQDVPIGGTATASGMLVHHPKGDLLVDGGNSSRYEDEIEAYSGADRFFYEAVPALLKPTTPLPTALRAMGVAPEGLRWFLPTHVHVDHVGGMMDMPDVPVLLTAPEAELVRRGLGETIFEIVPAHARRIEKLVKPIVFEPKPYLGFSTSLDFFGDGSLVVVPLPGHTPGSVGVIVDVGDGHPVFHVGDTVGSLDQLRDDEGKSWPMSRTDSLPEQTLERVHELHAFALAHPEVRIVPAHERAAWAAVFGKPAGCVR